MITSVIIRPRNGLVPAATADYSWEAVVNGEVILALNNFLEFEAWLQANAPSATNIAETRSTGGNNLRCYVSPDDLPLMILRWS